MPVRAVRSRDVPSLVREYVRLGYRCTEEPDGTAVCVRRINEVQEYVVVIFPEQ